MLEFLIFLRDALVAILLSWVGVDGDKQDQKPADKPEPAQAQVIAPVSKLH